MLLQVTLKYTSTLKYTLRVLRYMWVGLLNDRINKKLEKSNLIDEHALNREPVALKVSGKLPTYPFPKLTLTLTSHLGQNVGLIREGVGGQFPRNLNWSNISPHFFTSNLYQAVASEAPAVVGVLEVFRFHSITSVLWKRLKNDYQMS